MNNAKVRSTSVTEAGPRPQRSRAIPSELRIGRGWRHSLEREVGARAKVTVSWLWLAGMGSFTGRNDVVELNGIEPSASSVPFRGEPNETK
jgi:hypothetical protein